MITIAYEPVECRFRKTEKSKDQYAYSIRQKRNGTDHEEGASMKMHQHRVFMQGGTCQRWFSYSTRYGWSDSMIQHGKRVSQPVSPRFAKAELTRVSSLEEAETAMLICMAEAHGDVELIPEERLVSLELS